jgi:serine/threonine-protein kinase
LLQQLSAGSIGVVYRAKNPKIERLVALRQVQVPDWLDDVQDLLKSMLADARAANALDHPNIVRLYTGGYKEFTVFLTSEFIEGVGLKEYTRNCGLAQIMELARQLCGALDFAHEKNVFHHALTPANIKVTEDGTLKILDFGLSRDKNIYSPIPAKRLENEHYLSPEQIKNKPVDRAANLFSVAIILYELFTTRNPFAGKHLGEVDRNITEMEPMTAAQSHPRVPDAVSRVLQRGLAKNPGARFQSGHEFFAALEDAMSASPAKVAPAAAGAVNGSATTTTSRPAMPATAVTAPPAVATASRASVAPFPATYPAGPSTIATAPPAPSPRAAASAQTNSRMRPATATRTNAAPVPPGKMSAKSTNQWKLAAVIVTVLFVVSALAISMRHRTEAPAPPVGVADTHSAPVADTNALPTPDANTSPIQVHEVQRRTGREKMARVEAAPAASAPVASGQLVISSNPEGAIVEIAGRPGESGKTPLTVSSLMPGTYKITLSKPGYASETRNVEVAGGKGAMLDLKLTATKGYLTVAGTPAGAQIFLDGKDTGKFSPAEFTLDPAAHTVTLRKEGFLETGGEIKLAAGQSVSYAPNMKLAGRTDNIQVMGGFKKMFGGKSAEGMVRMEIKTEPKGAQVTVNGTSLPKPTPVEIMVEPGNYDITLEKDGYKSVKTSVLAQANDKLKIEETLKK